jgi:dTDP-4-dehydrorhamnose reductase
LKILLLGKNGQVGFELQRALAPLGDVTALDRTGCDLRYPNSVRMAIQAYRPDVVVNAAAYTAVDLAESEAELAHAINGVALGVLGTEAAKIGAVVVHYSTDYVFDGTNKAPYSEQDVACPINVYGLSKRAGEQALQHSGANCLIFRTTWVYGAYGNNFAKTMLRLAAEREILTVVSDQIGAPTSAALIADVTAHILQQMHMQGHDGFPFGLYNLTASGGVSWCGYAQEVIAAGHQAGLKLMATPETITPIATSDYPTPAARPLNSRLNTGTIQDTFNMSLPDWRDGLAHVLRYLL